MENVHYGLELEHSAGNLKMGIGTLLPLNLFVALKAEHIVRKTVQIKQNQYFKKY